MAKGRGVCSRVPWPAVPTIIRKPPVPETIADGKIVTIHYTLTLDDGSQVDSSRDGDPLVYLHGSQSIVPGLETALATKAPGEAVKVKVVPAEGYGDVDPEGEQRMPRTSFPEDLKLEVGMELAAEDDDGHVLPLVIREIGDEDVLIDMNHPLAGKNLNFAVDVLEVRTATAEEIEHGHAHGPDGHHHHHDDDDDDE
ncbi:MAG: FKBP-type peptidyl-prolyl cis-trans isomerase SlyD [Gammaproteobacteria bacterium]|jgi:FKBP-type peptidyl-prolyl cis-trans isomerase SlyD